MTKKVNEVNEIKKVNEELVISMADELKKEAILMGKDVNKMSELPSFNTDKGNTVYKNVFVFDPEQTYASKVKDFWLIVRCEGRRRSCTLIREDELVIASNVPASVAIAIMAILLNISWRQSDMIYKRTVGRTDGVAMSKKSTFEANDLLKG